MENHMGHSFYHAPIKNHGGIERTAGAKKHISKSMKSNIHKLSSYGTQKQLNFIMPINNRNRNMPTIRFPNGSIFVEPEREEIK